MKTKPSSKEELRMLVVSMLDRRPPVDAREQESAARFLSELDRLDDPCSEAADTTHVTASALVVSSRGLILHRHKRLGIWLQPGGHIDPGESAADASLRECLEETGLAAEHFAGEPMLVHVDTHDGPRGHYHLDLRFLLAAPDVDPTPQEGESPDVRWFTWNELRDHREPGIAGAVAAMRGFVLRPAIASEASNIAEVFLRSFRDAYRAGNVRLAHPDEDVRRWVREELLPDSEVTVAVSSGMVIGYVATKPGWIEHLYVDPAWIGRGVGSPLLAAARERLHGGCDLWTFQENARARAFYELHGFVAVGYTDGDNQERQPDVRYHWEPENDR